MPQIVVICSLDACGLPFYRRTSHAARNKLNYCSRDCYRVLARQLETVAYPRIWYNGKREYLHRVIYAENTGVSLEAIKDKIIHHIDGNAFNRSVSNLEIAENQAEHLRKHNYFRGNKNTGWKEDSDYPF